MVDYQKSSEIPDILRKFLIYSHTIQNKSDKTINEYFLDLRLFLRFMVKYKRNTADKIDSIDVSTVNLDFIGSISLDDIYEYLAYLATSRAKYHKSTHSPLGISSVSRSRKISSIRTFFKYLVDKAQLLVSNPISNIDFPKLESHLPKYLTLEESESLVNSVDGNFEMRDTCILLLFLSCGLRVSELVGINLKDISGNSLRVFGKGKKERIVYLNELCLNSINEYKKVRKKPKEIDKKALFISRQGNRISVQTVKWLVKKYVEKSKIDREGISAHKLRHTAATLMYSNGLDIRALQEVLGHKNLDTTMIYTHIDSANLRQAAQLNPIGNMQIKKANKT